MNGLSLCAGVGGLDLGIEIAFPAYRCIAAVENNEEAAKRFRLRFPQAKVFRDVVGFDGRRLNGIVDCVVAGWPCQPHSVAGKRLGTADERWIWGDVARILGECGAPLFFGENVSGLLRDAGSAVGSLPFLCQTTALWQGTNWMSPQMTLLGEWEAFCGIWPKWGFVSGGEVYELPVWAPRTAEIASSCWPTSRAEDSESTGAHGGATDTLPSTVELWNTPTASEVHRGSNRRYLENDNRTGKMLSKEAEMWRTPDAPKAGGSRAHTTSQGQGHQFTIADQAERWPSPAARDHRDPNLFSYQERTGTTKGEQLNNYVEHYWKTPRGLQLLAGDPGGGGEFAKQAERWPAAYSLPAPLSPTGLTFWQRVRILLPLCRQLRLVLPSPYRKAGNEGHPAGRESRSPRAFPCPDLSGEWAI